MSKPQITKLKNGLRIATDEMKDIETVSIGVFVHTGSRNENLEILVVIGLKCFSFDVAVICLSAVPYDGHDESSENVY